MNTVPEPVEIPDKSSFKPSEVCELLKIPSYVLRTWENEFKELGTAKAAGGARTYRPQDVELALRIRALVFAEHLTLAGVRRRLEQEHLITPPEDLVPEGTTAAKPGLSEAERARLSQAKDELRALLQQLANTARGAAGASPAVASREAATNHRAGVARTIGQDVPERAPALPGFDAASAPAGSGDASRSGPQEARLDPAALNFASVSAPPATQGRQRRTRR